MDECSERRRHRLGLDRACMRHAKPPAIVRPSMREVLEYGRGGGFPDLGGSFNARGTGRRGGGREMRSAPQRKPSSGAAPTPVPETVANTMALWIDTDPAYLALTAGRCTQLTTRDANAWVFTPPGSSAEPLSQATGLLSKPALFFTTDDYLSCTGGLAALLDGSQPYEEFVVGQLDHADIGHSHAVGGVGNTTLNQYAVSYFVSNIDTLSRRDAGTTANTGTVDVGTDPYFWGFNFTGTAHNSWLNDTQSMVAAANTRTCVGDIYTLGCYRVFGSYSGFYDGTIAEKIVYLGVLSTEDRAAIWAYFAAKYVGLVVPS